MATKTTANHDRRVDAYIASAPDFAQPILNHLRELAHAACPEAEETMKWSRPHFTHRGMLCGMAAFTQHCAFGFWMGDMVLGAGSESGAEKNGAGHFGRITTLADLPDDQQLLAYIRKAVELNESGAKRRVVRRPKGPRTLTVPDDVAAALEKNKEAWATFEASSYSHKTEYLEWITEAKRVETRQKRIATMLIWLVEGKSRNWKYTNC